eukprot:GHVU01203244.1.p1 GENE.GHVU01203244.1~~GHVU01203244.1.p1  ORF type:complete len:362 (-),score=40.98 GHVU01203244.1:358-1392(-)
MRTDSCSTCQDIKRVVVSGVLAYYRLLINRRTCILTVIGSVAAARLASFLYGVIETTRSRRRYNHLRNAIPKRGIWGFIRNKEKGVAQRFLDLGRKPGNYNQFETAVYLGAFSPFNAAHVVLVTDLDFFGKVLTNRTDFPQSKQRRQIAKSILGNTLVSVEGSEYTERRRALNTGFFFEPLTGYSPLIEGCCDSFIHSLACDAEASPENSTTIDNEDVCRFTMDILLDTLLGRLQGGESRRILSLQEGIIAPANTMFLSRLILGPLHLLLPWTILFHYRRHRLLHAITDVVEATRVAAAASEHTTKKKEATAAGNGAGAGGKHGRATSGLSGPPAAVCPFAAGG